MTGGGLLFEHCPQINPVRRSSTKRQRGVVRRRKAVQLFHGVITPAEPWKSKCLPGQNTGLRACSSHSISNFKMETRNIKVTFPLRTSFLLLVTSSTATGAGIRDTGEVATESSQHTHVARDIPPSQEKYQLSGQGACFIPCHIYPIRINPIRPLLLKLPSQREGF